MGRGGSAGDADSTDWRTNDPYELRGFKNLRNRRNLRIISCRRLAELRSAGFPAASKVLVLAETCANTICLKYRGLTPKNGAPLLARKGQIPVVRQGQHLVIVCAGHRLRGHHSVDDGFFGSLDGGLEQRVRTGPEPTFSAPSPEMMVL